VNGSGRGRDGDPDAHLEDAFAFSLTDSEMVETVFNPDSAEPLSYAVSPTEGEIYITPAVTRGNKLFKPPEDINNLISSGVVIFPSDPTDYGTGENLDADIRAFVHRYTDVPPFWEALISEYVKMSWVYDRFSAIPYLRFLGEWQSGKTRLASVAARISYRTCSVSGATSPAAMYRLIALFKGTLFVDEADFGNSDLWSEVAKVFNCGYRRGNPIVKCDKDNMPDPFDVFCPKILSARKPFADQATNSRCLTLNTHQKPIRADVGLQVPRSFEDEARDLRNKLLTWRLRNYWHVNVDRSMESKLSRLEPRMIEIIGPLIAVSNDPEFHAELIEFCRNYTAQQRADSPQAIIVQAIRLLSKGSTTVLSVQEVAQRASLLREAEEPQAALEAMKSSRTGNGEEPVFFTARRAGYLIRALGFNPMRTNTGFRFDVTEAKLRELDSRYPKSGGRASLV
jgi:hypothetical protein